jgi:probable F420-dependent oxidoreductase
MKLGLFGMNLGACADPDVLAYVVKAAEGAGFESVWTGEHVVVPDPQVPPSPMAPRHPALDPLLALTWAASATTSVRLATGIVILPQRNPLVLAKQVASLDVLCGGRFMLGVGVGYLEPEFRAVGANFEQRGAVTDDYLSAMEALWYSEHPVHHGPFADFEGVDAYPRPVQSPIPVIVGGRTPAAFRRAVSRGAGWYGFFLTAEETSAAAAGLRQTADRAERRPDLGPLELTVTPRGRLTSELVAEFAEIGVTRLVPWPGPAASRDEIVALIDKAAAAVTRA